MYISVRLVPMDLCCGLFCLRLRRLSLRASTQVDFSGKQAFWKSLKPPAKDKCGELLASLCYHPSNSILTLTLLKARNLKAKDINGKSGMMRTRNVPLDFPHF